jgi:hypothetical protein
MKLCRRANHTKLRMTLTCEATESSARLTGSFDRPVRDPIFFAPVTFSVSISRGGHDHE